MSPKATGPMRVEPRVYLGVPAGHPLEGEDVTVEAVVVPAVRVTHVATKTTLVVIGTETDTLESVKLTALDGLLDRLEQSGGG